MKTLAVTLMLLVVPGIAFADKYEDMQMGIREILIAMSAVSVQGKDAPTFAQIQQALAKVSKDVGDLQKEYKATQDEVVKCKEESKVEEVKE